MDVSVTDLRAHLSDWLDRVQEGEAVVVTERGRPVARVVPVTASPLLAELEGAGSLARPATALRPSAAAHPRVRARRPVADVVSSQRD
ncbi:MAG: type II toxin-antitoxin system Phd/YefM family antitoxin [Acidimicrobiia bacterium]